MAADELQAQIEAQQAQQAQLQAQIAELERQNVAAAAASAAPSAPAGMLPEAVPSVPPLPTVPSGALPPADDVPMCATFSGDIIPCQKPEDLVNFGELFKPPPVDGFEISVPSLEQLKDLDTLLPLIGFLAALPAGFIAFSKVTAWLRPDDAAATRRKREERERLGVTEDEQEQESRTARDNLLVVVLLVVFEIVLFNLRGVISG
jgi:hypothetical protein